MPTDGPLFSILADPDYVHVVTQQRQSNLEHHLAGCCDAAMASAITWIGNVAGEKISGQGWGW